jgi:predicted transcriptional regulator
MRGDGWVDADRHGWGALGRAIVEILDAADGPQTPAQVRAALGGDRAYTTVMTVMARLAERGVLVRHRAARGYAYTRQPDRTEVTARQMHRLLDTEADRYAVLARFVDQLSPGDEQILAHLLTEISSTGDADAEARR